jgi:hypothetical protein
MDELNDLIAAMPDGSTLTLEEGATYEMSGAIRVLDKRDFTLRLAGATIRQPLGLDIDLAGSTGCTIACDGANFVPTAPEQPWTGWKPGHATPGLRVKGQ